MKNNLVTILDFGSSKITCMSGLPTSANGNLLINSVGNFVIKAVGQSTYNGFDNDDWYEPETIKDAVLSAVRQVEDKTKCRIRQLTVGVPGAFCAVATSEASLTFRSNKRIDADDIAEVVNKANIFSVGNEMSLLSARAVNYALDGVVQSDTPIDRIASKLTALASFSFVKNNFVRSVRSVLSAIGIKRVKFVNSCEVQADFISKSMNSASTIIIDVGHITTNVMLFGGNALLFERTFALGSGYLASDICQVMECGFDFAMNLLQRVNLNLDVQTGDTYSVNGRNVDAHQTNEVIRARICQIADYVIKSFSACDREIPTNTDVVLTGGGLTYLRGGADCLSQYLGKTVKTYTSFDPQTRRNEYTSCYGLLAQSVQNNLSNKSFFRRWKNKGDI